MISRILNDTTNNKPFHHIRQPIWFKLQDIINNGLPLAILVSVTKLDHVILLDGMCNEAKVLLRKTLT